MFRKKTVLTAEEKTTQAMEECFVQNFKRLHQCMNEQEVAQYVQKRWLFPAANDMKKIDTPETLMHIKAICGAAYRTKVPLEPYSLLYVQNQAEEGHADALAQFMQAQSEKFKKVCIWYKCSPIAQLQRMWSFRR